MSLPESMRSPSSAFSSVRVSPAATVTSGSPAALPAWYAEIVWDVTEMVGPESATGVRWGDPSRRRRP